MFQKDLYGRIYDFFGGDPAKISMIGSNVIMIGLFWLVGGLFLLVDVTQRPRWMFKYKVQQDKNVPIDRKKLLHCIKVVAINNLLVNTVVATYPMYSSQVRRGCSFEVEDVPSWARIAVDIFVSSIVQEVIFYYSHRLFHVPFFYKWIHKQHHQWTAPIGIVAIYTHPIEYLTGNGLSVLLGPILMKSHIFTFFVWYALANVVTIVHHSGYHLPFLPSPEFHDYHHATFNWNFGTLGFLDKWHGTDKQFRGSVEWRRHETIWGINTIRNKFPDTSYAQADWENMDNGKTVMGDSRSVGNSNGVSYSRSLSNGQVYSNGATKKSS